VTGWDDPLLAPHPALPTQVMEGEGRGKEEVRIRMYKTAVAKAAATAVS